MPEHTIIFAEKGMFVLSDGSLGNPGCDECGMESAVAKLDEVYLCHGGLMLRVDEGMFLDDDYDPCAFNDAVTDMGGGARV